MKNVHLRFGRLGYTSAKENNKPLQSPTRFELNGRTWKLRAVPDVGLAIGVGVRDSRSVLPMTRY